MEVGTHLFTLKHENGTPCCILDWRARLRLGALPLVIGFAIAFALCKAGVL